MYFLVKKKPSKNIRHVRKERMNLQEEISEADISNEIATKRRRRRLFISGVFVVASLLFLLWVIYKNKWMALENVFGVQTQETAAPLRDHEMLKLATEARNAGLILQGVMECGWTQRQLDLFGPVGSPARREIEKIYVECTSRDVCPNVRGFPNWSRGNLMFPGFRPADRIRSLIEETKNLPVEQQVTDSSEPIEENIPDARALVRNSKKKVNKNVEII